MDQRRLQLSLVIAQVVGAATLLRSVAYDRWITVLAAALLIVGASAARRGRSWGVGLALGAAASFPVAWAIGIAPPWFCLVGALPFAIASRAFARFDTADDIDSPRAHSCNRVRDILRRQTASQNHAQTASDKFARQIPIAAQTCAAVNNTAVVRRARIEQYGFRARVAHRNRALFHVLRVA